MFLPSTTEVGLANENNIAEGTLLALFSNGNFPRRLSYGAMREQFGAHEQQFQHVKGLVLVASASFVSAGGVATSRFGRLLHFSLAYYGYIGDRPLCNLKSSILVI